MSSNVKALNVLRLHVRTHAVSLSLTIGHIQQDMSTTVTSTQFDKSKTKNFADQFSLKLLIMEISTFYSTIFPLTL